MKTPFKISFKKEIKKIPNRNILEDFRNNFIKSYCDHIKIYDDKELIVKNEFIRWKPDWNLNLWVGIGEARIRINESEKNKNKVVKYSIDFTRLTFAYIFTLVFFALIFSQSGIWDFNSLKYLLIAVGTIALLMHIITFLRHWSIFNRTIKYGTDYLGNYDWNSIIRSKTDLELLEIKNGQRQLPKTVIRLVELEIENRKTSKKTD